MGLEDVSIGIEATGADTTADAINKVTTAVKGLNDAPTSNLSAFATSLDNVKNSATGVNTPLTTAATGVQSLGGAYDETATKSKTLENSFSDLGSTTQSTSQNFQTFASSMVGLVGSVASVTSGIIGIAQGYTEMERAQTLAQRSSDRYRQAVDTENNLREKLNKLIADGQGGTQKAAQLEEQIALAHNKTATALETLNNNQSRANETTASFYNQIIPQAVGIIGGLATAINTIPTAWDKIKNVLSGSNIFGGLKADVSDVAAAEKDASTAANDVGTALNTESSAANTAATATRSLKVEALALAAPFLASAAAVVGFSLAMQKIGENAPAVHDFFTSLDTQLDGSTSKVKGWATDFGDALASTGSFFNDNVKQIESWGGLNKSVMNASADEVQKYSDEFARTEQSESYYWDLRFKQWKQAADDSHQSYSAISKDNIDQMREDQNKATVAAQVADAVAAAKKKEEDATKHYQEVVKDTAKVLQDDLSKSLDTLTQETTGVIKNWEQFGSSGTTVRTAFVDLNTAVQNTTKGLESHNQFADETIKILSPLREIAHQVGGTFLTEYNAALIAAQKVHVGVSDSIQPIIDHLKAMDDATHSVNAGINAQKDAFHAAGLAMIDQDGKLQQLNTSLQDGTQVLQSFKQGQQDAYQTMLNNEEAIAKEAGSVTDYYAELATGRPLNDAFVKGFADQAKAFGDNAVAIADTQGKLAAYFLSLTSGTPQLEAFLTGEQDQYLAFIQNGLAIDTTLGKQQEYFREIGSGVLVIQDQNKALTDLLDAFEKSDEKLIALNTGLGDSRALWDRYSTDVNTGKSAVLEFETKLQDTKVAEDTQLAGLEGIAANIQGWPTWMTPTISSIEDFISANYRGAQAVIDFNQKASKAWSELTSAGDTFFSGIIKAMGETGKTSSDDFTKAFKDLPAQVQKLLTPSDQASLAAEAAFASAGDAAGQAFAIKTEAAIGEGFTPQQALQIGSQSAASIIQGFVQQHPQFAAQAQQFFSVLSTGSAEQIKTALDQMAKMPGPLGEIARQAQINLKPMFAQLGPDAQTSVKSSTDALTQLGLSVNAVSGQVTTASGQIIGNMDKVSGAFTPVSTAIERSSGAIKQLGLDVNTTSGQVTTASGEIVGQVDPVTGAFTAANTSAANFAATIKGFGDISSAAQIVFQGIVTNANTMATNLGTSFHQMSGFAVKGFGDISSTAQITFQGIVTGANTLATNLGTAFHQASGFVASHFGEMSFTAQTTFNNMVTQANSVPTKIGDAFKPLPAALAQTWGTISQNAQTTFNNMVRQAQIAAQQIAAAFRAATAPTAQGAYSPYQGVYGAQTGQAGYYTPYQGVFAQHGFVGVVDKPTSFVVGEAGPEYVSVIPGGSAGTIGNSMITGLADMVIFLSRTNTAMSSNSSASNKNTLALDNATLAADKSKTSLDNVTLAGNTNLISTNNNTVATDNATKALNLTTNAVTNTTAALSPISPAASNTISGLIGTAGAANNTTGSLNGLTSAADSLASKINQIIQTPGGIGGGGVAGGGGGVQGSAGPFAGLAAQIGPGGGGAVPAVFAPYAQYGNFSGQSPAAAPGAAYYGGPPTGGGGGGGTGAFGAYAQYGNFGGSSPAPASGAAYYGGPPTQQGVGQGAFGAYSQYGNFGGGGSAGGGQAPSGGGQQAAPQKAQGGVMGPQGGASSPQQQPSGGASYYGGPPAGYQSSPYGAFGGYSQFGKFAASGFEGIVTQATRFVAGEAGPEHVKVTPLSNVASSSNDVNSIMAMIAELVRQIAGQSMNINLNSYLDGYTVYKNQQKYTNGRLGNYLG
jgi:hypothetical protein